MVDDPFVYGQIAAANALSDVYAMGGQPLLALNIVCFRPVWIREFCVIFCAAELTKPRSRALLVGGHSLDDQEPKYGLAVTGIVKPEEVWSNAGAAPGDVLVLTKPIGTGLFLTAYKVDLVSGGLTLLRWVIAWPSSMLRRRQRRGKQGFLLVPT